jgi:hypothetical protein
MSLQSNLDIGTREAWKEEDRKAGVWRAEREGREMNGKVKREYGVGEKKQTHGILTDAQRAGVLVFGEDAML